MAGRSAGLTGVREVAGRLTPMQKIGIGAAVVAVVAVGVVLRGSAAKPMMTPLFTDLEAADASAVVDQLTSEGIAYQLTDSGHTVLVPNDKVYDIRISLAAQGLPEQNDGYALLDQQGITTSEFKQRVDYQRALEGELAKTLKSIDGVTKATVRLALPDEPLFTDKPARPTASVMLATRGDDVLTDETVQAVVHLVAASVKDLKPADVTVVDAAGTLLSSPEGGASGGSAATARAKAEQSYEQGVQRDIVALIAPVAGPDSMSVSVKAALDLAQRTTTSETFGPFDEQTGEKGPGVIQSSSEATETFEGTGAAASTGVLGPDGATIAQPGSAADKYDKSQTTQTFGNDRKVEQVAETPGTLTGLHVAVVLDAAAVDADQATAIESTVKAAIGFDETRGDTLQVTRLAFAPKAELPAGDTTATDTGPFQGDNLSDTVRTGALALAVLLAIGLGALSARRARRIITEPLELEAGAAHHNLELQAAATAPVTATYGDAAGVTYGVGAGATATLPSAPATLALDPAARELKELMTVAEQNPAEVANVLRTWLVEDREARR
ncbi:MAG: flagellar basal-body MS-ring/collar protein FliF [Ilumatobacteraceae bacterium]